jgi:recombination protein RecR
MLPAQIQNLADEFRKLPSIGKKSSERLALYILRISRKEALDFSQAIEKVKNELSFCKRCNYIAEKEECEICLDAKRDKKVICVVEDSLDVIAIEKSGGFKGRYHVLQGVIAPSLGIGPDELKIKELRKRIEKEGVKEVIIATNPTTEGETTAMYVANELKDLKINITRIARGLPTGADLEYADDKTLTSSFSGRKEFRF